MANIKSAFRQLRGVRIGFLGAGTMGQALIQGLLAKGISRRSLRAADANPEIRRLVRRRFGISTTDDSAELARWADVVILAVKPQQLPEAMSTIEKVTHRTQLVISIAAGVTLRWLRQRLPRASVVRVMPNLPSTVGCGFAAVAAGPGTSAGHRAIARAIFNAVGVAVDLPERQLNAVTAISGSGPAYVFFLLAAWEQAARALGLPERVGSSAVRRTLEGSLRLLESSGEPPETLISRVASKRGTTEAALQVLAHHRVAAHFVEALRAAANRAKELSI